MKAVISLDYQNTIIHASREAWVSATEIAQCLGNVRLIG